MFKAKEGLIQMEAYVTNVSGSVRERTYVLK